MGPSIHLLGRTRVEVADRPVGQELLGRYQTRVALAALVLERHVGVRADVLAEVLWPSRPPDTWPTAVRGAVSRVRTILTATGVTPAGIDARNGSYHLTLPSSATVDVEDAQGWVVDAERGLAEAGATPTAAPAAWEAVEDKARAAATVLDLPFLPDCDAPWAQQWRRRLQTAAARANTALAGSLRARGLVDAAVVAAEQALALDPLRERSHRLLIELHTEAGDRGAALRAYERCRQLLGDELGVPPSPQTERAYLAALGTEPPAFVGGWPPFTGRRAELATLSSLWVAAGRGSRQLAVVTGDPGIGKSRLVRELVDHVEGAEARVLRGRYERGTAHPNAALAGALADEVERVGIDEVQALGPAAADLLPLWPELRGHLPAGLPTPDAADEPSDAAQQWRLHRALEAWLGGAHPARPTVLLLDDIQWAVPRSLAWLRSLLASERRLHLLVIATCRIEDAGRDPVLASALADLYGRDGVTRLELDGLDVPEVAELVDAAFDHRLVGGAAPALAAAITTNTGGNPLLIAEVLRHLTGRGLVRRRTDGGWELDGRVEDLDVPSALAELLCLRLTALGPRAQRALTVAAVLGDGDAGPLSRILGHDAADELAAAAGEGFIRRTPGGFRFSHDAVPEVLIGQLDRHERAMLHVEVATTLLERADPSRSHGAAALHLHAAARLGADVAPAAVDACRAAAEGARARRAPDEAVVLLGHALELAEALDDAELECDVSLALGEAMRHVGDPAYRSVLERAAELARRTGDGARLTACVVALHNWGLPATSVGRADLLLELANEALERLPHGTVAAEAQLRTILAVERRWDAGAAACFDDAMGAVALAEQAEDPAVLAMALMGTMSLAPFDPPAARRRADRLADLALQVPDWIVRCHAAIALVNASLQLGDARRADRELARLDELAGRFRMPYFEWLAMAMRAGRLVLAGAFDEADPLADRAAGFAAARGIDPSLVAALHAGARLISLLDQGRAEEAVEALAPLQPFAGDDPSFSASLAVALVEAGRADDAARSFEVAVRDDLRHVENTELGACTLVNLARAAAGLGDGRRARLIAPRLEPLSGYLCWTSNLCLGPIDLALAWCAIAAGEPDDAIAAHLEQAARVAEAAGADPWLRRIRSTRSHPGPPERRT